jgi:hypothetical protein
MSTFRRESVIEGSELSYTYFSITPEYAGTYRIRLHNNVIETCRSQAPDYACENPLNASGYQPLTDINTIKITAFSVSPNQAGGRARTENGDAIALPCENLCTVDPTNGGATSCWPTVKIQELVVWVSGQSVADERITRTMKATVRLRNPNWKVADPIGGVPARMSCPDLPYTPS